jgi:hypothetical protein
MSVKKTEPAPEYLYRVVGDLWDPVRYIGRVQLLKRSENTCKVESGSASGHKRVISYDEMRRIGLVGSTRVAVIEWRMRLKKQHDDLIDELKQIEKVLAGPDPEEDFE